MTHEVKEPVVGETVGVYFGNHYIAGEVLHFSQTAIVIQVQRDDDDHRKRTVSINNAAVLAITQWPDLPINKKHAPAVRHEVCQYCDQDIEGVAPFRRGTWRDRGSNTTCSSGPYVGGNHSPE